MTDLATAALEIRASELLRLGVPAEVIGWVAHRTASPRALALLDVVSAQSGDPTWLAAAGYERGTRATNPQQMRRAAADLARANDDAKLPMRYQELLVELLIQTRQDEQVRRLLAEGRLPALSQGRRIMAAADLTNPFRSPGLSEETWLRTIQPLLGELTPVALRQAEDGDEPLDRLYAPVVPATVHGDLVSVVVSSYRPGPELRSAVRSILAQSWADLEVLVVDDASGPDFSELYAEVEGLDPRVRVVRQPINGGTYVARNTAIDQARGVYVTFQDADDWSHPERVERQVAVLAADPLVHCVRAHSLRTAGSLVFSRQGSAVRAPAAATLMFRREQVWPALGGYDTVRKAADTEFHERIGVAIPGYGVDLTEPLMWVRLGEGSLSRSEFRANWKHPARLTYRSAFSHWHEQIALGASSLMRRSVRSFPAPHRFRLDRNAPPDEFDVIVLGDWRGDGNAARDAVDWLRILAGDGVRVGLVHVESLNYDGRRPSVYMRSVQDLVASGTVEVVPWDAPVRTAALVAIEPEVLEFLPEMEPGARAKSVVVLLDGAPRNALTLNAVKEIVRDRWEARVVWSLRGAALADSVAAGIGSTLGPPFPLVIPGEQRPSLHRPRPLVVLAPLGMRPEVLEEVASAANELATAGVEVRVRIPSGLRRTVRSKVGARASRVLWAASTNGAAAAEVAVATDVVVVGEAVGIDYERIAEEARRWAVRLHVLRPGTTACLHDIVEAIRAAEPVEPAAHNDRQSRSAAAAAVRAWFESVATLDKRPPAVG